MIRVLFFITDLALGGTPRSVESLVLGLDRTKFEPEVVTLLAPSPITESIAKAGIPCRALDLRSKTDVARLAALPGIFARGRFDIVHAWLFHANILARLLRPFARCPVLTSERGVEKEKSPFRVWVDRVTSPLADLVLVNARAISDVLTTRERIDPAKIRVLENGVDLSRFSSGTPQAGPPRIICVARLDPIKAHVDLLAALPPLIARWPALTLDLVGDGPMRATLEDQARALGVEKSVRFLGARTDVPALLAGAHVFVLPSLSEGMPGSVLEAMASGLPVVATRVGGTPEIVEEGRTGLLVDPARPEALSKALSVVIEDPQLAANYGEAGARRARERYTREAFIRRHEAVYEEIVSRSRR